MTRRQVLGGIGQAGVFAALGAPLWAAASTPAPSETATIDQLAAVLRSASRTRALELAADAARKGATIETVLGAVLQIGVEEIRPRPHGILHTVMMVQSTFSLAADAGPREAWLAVLWNLDDLKNAQSLDREEWDDWKMPPAPEAGGLGLTAARAELAAAMEDQDPDRADRAVVALLSHVNHEQLFELLWPYAVRCRAFIGHKVIYAAQLERSLRRLPPESTQPAVRSLVRALLVGRETGEWEANLERVADPPAKVAGGGGAPDGSWRLYRRLRAADSKTAVTDIDAALRDGMSLATAWDALRLVASEIFNRRPGRRSNSGRDALLPVHAVTVVNALGHIARTTDDQRLARLSLYQAAAWLPIMRDWLAENVGLPTDGPSLEVLGHEIKESPTNLDDALATGSPAVTCAYLRGEKVELEGYGRRIRTALLRSAREHHQHKYAAAMLEEGSLADRHLRPFLLAPAVDYVANPADGTTELHERSLAALRRAGIS